MAEVERQIRAIDAVQDVERLGYAEPVALTTQASITGRLRVKATSDPAAVLDEVVEVVWGSDVSPIEQVVLQYAVGSDELFTEPEFVSLTENRQEFRSRWGPGPAPRSS